MARNKNASGLRKFGLERVGDVPWGTHLCQFYQTKEDLIDILVPYFKAGLESNEFCMWVTAEPLNTEEAKKALEKSVPDFSKYLKSGQLEIISYKDWYVKGGTFNCDRVLQGWTSKLEQALKNGYAGLRLTGNTFWLEKADWNAFTDYEEAVNNVIGKYRMIAVCTYSLEKCNANEIIDVIKNHQFALVKRLGNWELIESTEKKRVAEDLRKMDAELKNLAKFPSENPNVVLRVRNDGVHLYSNPTAKQVLGVSFEAFGGKLPEHWKKHVADAFSSGKKHSFEQEIKGRTYCFMAAPIASEGYVNIYGEDITDRKEAEQALHQAKRDWERTFDSVPDLVAVLDTQHRIVRANKAMAQKLNVTPEQCIGLNCYSCVHGTEAPPDFCPHSKTVKDGLEHVAEVHEDRLGGYFLVSTTPLKDEQGLVIGSVHVARDITRRKKNEEVIRESQKDLNRAQTVAKTGSWRLDTRQNSLLWSDETYRMFGIFNGTPLTYETFLGFVHPEDRKHVDAKWNAALRGEPYDIEHRIVVNGEVKWVREKAELEFSEDKKLLGGFGTVQDITEHKRMQEKLEESAAQLEEYANQMEHLANERAEKLKDAERLAAIGATAGMVGHDIRNPLQSIIGELYLAKDNLISLPEGDCKESLKETIATIEEQVGYINKIVTDLQDFAKPLKPCLEETNLENIVQSVISTIAIPENITFTYSLETGFPKFAADTAYIKRILTNLLSNAIQAMPRGGKLMLQAQVQNGSVTITVADTGVGIPENAKSKLFQPLFTTKSKGQGFGLAVCKRLVDAMDGTITFESQEGKGTEFTVKLPSNGYVPNK